MSVTQNSRANAYEAKGWLTVAQLAAFLKVTPAAVRKMAAREDIRPVGRLGRASVYAAREFVLKVGAHDRGVTRKRRARMSHLSHGQVCPDTKRPRDATNVRGQAD